MTDETMALAELLEKRADSALNFRRFDGRYVTWLSRRT
jgi:hypothetical protein